MIDNDNKKKVPTKPPDDIDREMRSLGLLRDEKPTPAVKVRGDDTVARVVDDEFSKLGYSPSARLSILGDVGRENSWDRNTIFGGHSDPANRELNRGIISWQKDRRTKLDDFLKKEGVYGRQDDDELRGMVRFMDRELQDEYAGEYKSLKSAASTRDASKALRRYIRYSMDPKYNTPDPDFEAKHNRNWANKARELGLAKDAAGASFDFDTFAAELMGDKKPKTVNYPSTTHQPNQPTRPSDTATLPPGTPFYSDAAKGSAKDFSKMTPEELDAERARNGVIATPGAEGYKYSFEVDGKIGEGRTYTGSFNGRYFGKDADGNDWEFDQLARQWKSTKPLPMKLKLSDGTELVEDGEPTAEGGRRMRSKDGRRFEAIEGARESDAEGNESVSWLVKPEASPTNAQQGNKPAQLKSRKMRPTASEATVLEDAKSYGFEQTGRLKLKDGTELGLMTEGETPDGKARFRDADGETYLFDRETGQLEDESLKEHGATVAVERSPITDSLEAAKRFRARQVATSLAAQYGLDAEDVEALTLQRGFTDLETGGELDQKRYYKDRSQIAELGAGDPDDFHQLTRRDLRDIVAFGREQKKKREDAMIALMAQGEEVTPELLSKMRIDPAAFQSERYDDLQMAATKGKVASVQLNQLVPRFKAQGQDDYQARVNAKRAMGFVSREEASADLEAYERILNDKRASTASLNLGPQREYAQFVDIERIRDEQARLLADETARRYGSAANYERSKDLEARAEEDRLKRIEAMPFVEKWTSRVAGVPARIGRGAINTLLAESLKGAVVWTKPVVDFIENLTGLAPEIRSVEDHPFTRAGVSIEKWTNWLTKTNKDIDQELLAGKLPQVVGTSLAMMLPSLSKNPRAAIALYSTLQMGGGSYSEARRAGASEEDALKFALVNSGLFGWTETLGISKALLRLKTLSGGAYKQFFQQLAKSAPNEIAEEVALNEGPQTIGQNYLAKTFYDPDRDVLEGLGESLLLAGLSAGGVSTLVTAANTVRNSQAIRAQLENDRAHGLPQFRNFGEAGVYIHGRPSQVTPEMEPLVAEHKSVTDEIKFAHEAIRRIRNKAGQTDNVNEKLNLARTVRDLQAEVQELYTKQTDTARKIIEISGVPEPTPIELRDRWEAAANSTSDVSTNAENFDTSSGDVDSFDATLEDGRRVKIIEDRGESLKVEDERGRISLQPVRKFTDLEAYRSSLLTKTEEAQANVTNSAESIANVKSDAISSEAEFVHERSVTLQAQSAAMMDEKNASAIGTLYTNPTDASVPKGTSRFVLPDGVLVVNNDKFRAKFGSHPVRKRTEIESGQIPHEELIGGKAVPDRDTTKGTAVVTVDANGNELNASKISDRPVEEWTEAERAAAVKQANLDASRFGDKAASTGIADTDEIIASRQEDRPIKVNGAKGFKVLGMEVRPQGVAALKYKRDEATRRAETDARMRDEGGFLMGNAEALNKALKQLAEDEEVTVFDANNFGKVNKVPVEQGGGELAGNKAIVEVGRAIFDAARENANDRSFRQGGDEFAVISKKGLGDKIRSRAEEIYGVREYGGVKVSLSGVTGRNFDEASANLQTEKAKRKAAIAEAEKPARKTRAVIEPPKAAASQPKRERTPLEKYEDYKLGRQGFSKEDIDELSAEDRKRAIKEKLTKRDLYRKTEKVIYPVSLAKPLFVDISRSVRARLRKKNTVRRLQKLGYAFQVEVTRARITGIPPGMKEAEVAGTFESLVYNTDEARRSKVGEGNVNNLRSLKRASLAQFVRAAGGIAPGTFQSQARGRRREGELERFRGEAGIINERSGRTIEDMARSAQDAGYFGLDEDSGTGGGQLDPNVFLEALEADLAGQKVYPVFGGVLAEEGSAVIDDEVARIERERAVHHILGSLTEEEFDYTQKLSRLFNDPAAFPILEGAYSTGSFSGDQISKLAKIGTQYELEENETETAIQALAETFGRWLTEETETETAGSEDYVEDYLTSGFGSESDPFEDVPIFILEEPEDSDIGGLTEDELERLAIIEADSSPIETAAHEAATSPTNDLPDPSEAQKEAGNYKKGHISISGLNITVENPEGSTRSGTDTDGKEWNVVMRQHYGYIKRSVGADEEQIDVFVKPGTPADFSGDVYVIDQIDPKTGEFDEHKAMLGFGSETEAREAYSANYEKDWKGLGEISAMPVEEFKNWIAEEQNRPAAILFSKLSSDDQAQIEKDLRIFKRDIKLVLDGEMPRFDSAQVMAMTPRYLRKLGLNAGPVRMPQRVVEKAVEAGTAESIAHNIAPDVLERLPAELANPVAVFESLRDPNDRVVLTTLENRDGLPVTAVLTRSKQDGSYANVIPSVTQKDHLRFFGDWIGQGKLLVAQKEMASDWLRRVGLQLPEDAAKTLTERSVENISKFVNARADGPLFSRSASAFYSQAERVIEEKMPSRASAEQIRGILSPANGVKQEEIDWIGIDGLFAENANPSKQEVLDYIRANNADVREVMKGGSTAEDVEYFIDQGYSRETAEQMAQGPSAMEPTTFSQYTLPGGENYRELLLTIPERDSVTKTSEKVPRGWGDTEGGEIAYRTHGDTGADFRSSHWAEPNVLAHVRFDDRDGGKTLHIAEIQSDWHQKGRKEGYRKTVSSKKRQTLETERAALSSEAADAESRVGEEFDARYPADFLRSAALPLREQYWRDRNEAIMSDTVYSRAMNRITEINTELGDFGETPDAPFKKSWPLMAFKRVLRHAVENGYERVTWDTGETNAERFDLSRKIERVQAERLVDGRFGISANPKSENEFEYQEGRFLGDFDADKLPEVVGKDLAEKIIEQGGGTFEGLDLKVGGEGMIGFYDRILPKEVGRYVKKWGARVATGSVRIGDGSTEPFDTDWATTTLDDGRTVYSATNSDGSGWRIYETDTEGFELRRNGRTIESYPNLDAAKDGASYHAGFGTEAVHSVSITPAMRESVMAGQPLFKRRDAAAAELLANVLPQAHTQEIFEGIESRFEREDLFLNEYAAEQVRRLLGTQEFNYSGKERDQETFDGVTIGAGQLKALAALGRDLSGDYLAAGYSPELLEAFDGLVENLDELAKRTGDFGVMFTFDDVLPEEHFHQEDLRAGRTSRDAIEKLRNSEIWKNPGQAFLSEYPDLSDADKASEIAAKLATDQGGKYGWASLPNFEQIKDEFLSTWAKGVIDKNRAIIDQKGVDWFIDKFRRISSYADLANSEARREGADDARREGRVGRDPEKRSREAGPAEEPATEQQAAGQTGGSDRSAEEQESVKFDELDAQALGVTLGEVRVRNRQFARSLRESGRDAVDVPYVPESETGWIEEAKKILDESIRKADASDFVKHDYSHALDVFENPETPNSTRVVLGTALIDHLGAIGDYTMMLRVGEMTTRMVGNAAQALRASQLVSKYDFAKGIELATRALKKRGKVLSAEEIEEIREMSQAYNAAVSEKAEIERSLQDAQTILEDQKAEISELENELESRDSAIGEQLENLEQKDRLISNLTRQIDRWKKKREAEKEAKSGTTVRNTVYRKLVSRRAEIEAAVRAAFADGPLKSVIKFDLPTITNATVLDKEIEMRFETPSGRSVVKKMTVGERQRQISAKRDALERLAKCVSGK